MIRGIHHVGINTGNLDRMLTFYRDVLGFTEAGSGVAWRDNPGIDAIIGVTGSAARSVMLWSGSSYVELFEYSAPPAADRPPLRPQDRGYTHIALNVEDIDAELDRLNGAGATFQRRPAASDRLRSIYGSDPDGNVVELLEIVQADHPQRLPSH